MEFHDWMFALAGLAFTSAGAAWSGVKLALNGLKKEMSLLRSSVDRLHVELSDLDERVQRNRENIASITSRCYAYHGGENWPIKVKEE